MKNKNYYMFLMLALAMFLYKVSDFEITIITLLTFILLELIEITQNNKK
jgi:hypothetical protein